MVQRSRERHAVKRQANDAVSPYVLIVRGPDGRPRAEQFKDAAAYRARVAALRSTDGTVSIAEIVRLLGA
ncbi:MAG: hypothetical protein HYZ58_15865 [Acidobacteria bacterium]|nr:hypothetical protein [Acidobacteriota bacterium]